MTERQRVEYLVFDVEEKQTGQFTMGVGFSPDGRAIAYVANYTVDEEYDVYVVPMANGPGTPVRIAVGRNHESRLRRNSL